MQANFAHLECGLEANLMVLHHDSEHFSFSLPWLKLSELAQTS